MYTDDEMEEQSSECYTDDETGEETEEEHHTLTDQESIENYEESEEEDSNPWEFILDEVYQKMDPIRDATVDKTMQANGITYEEVTKHVYDALLPDYTKELMKIYIKYLKIYIKYGYRSRITIVYCNQQPNKHGHSCIFS